MWIASGIQLRDNPGKLSMFETEVKFAADCLNSAKKSGPGLILFDELFHSTNPPDGSRTAIQFLHRMWKHPDLFSVVSTHLFPLVGAAPKNVKAICCTAKEEDNGDITFSYAVEPGICKVSSVHTVWEQFGLAKRRSPRSSQEQQTLPAKEKEKDGN
jgi:DNA mismatch repair ATPase MutS